MRKPSLKCSCEIEEEEQKILFVCLFVLINIHNLALYVREMNLMQVYIQFSLIPVCGLILNHPFFWKREKEQHSVGFLV